MNERFYLGVRALARVIMGVFFPYRAHGAELIPKDGSFILCGNHQSLSDPILAACAVNPPIRFMGKKELFVFKPLGAFMRGLGVFPVDRGKSDLSAMRAALSILQAGSALGIFPEGRRAFKGGGDFQTGVALIAIRSQKPVYPLYVARRARLFRRSDLYFGDCVDLAEYKGKYDSETLKAVTARIRDAVYGLAPEKNVK